MPALSSQLTVLVPGLLGPPAERVDRSRWLQVALEAMQLGALEKLLGHAEPIDDPYADTSLEGIVCRAFAVEPESNGNWPIGAACYNADSNKPDEAPRLRVDPVYVRPGLAEVTLQRGEEIDIEAYEASALCEELNQHFGGQPALLEAPTPTRWYIKCTTVPSFAGPPPSLAAAGWVEDLFPTGSEAREWRSWLNEAQMVLHASTINQARAGLGKVPVNSLWLWGGGAPLKPTRVWNRVTTDEFLASALAHAAGIQSNVLPSGYEAWGAPEHTSRDLVVLDSLYHPVQNQDIETWRRRLAGLHDNWFRPLLDRLSDSTYSSIDLHPGFGRAFRATGAGRKRFWKRSSSLLSLLEVRS